MVFPVSKVAGEPRYDALPVAKVIDYPLEKRDYKPYAQNQLCVGEDCLHLRMWAFEVSPMPTSRLLAVLYLYPGQPDLALALSAEVPRDAGEKGRNTVSACLLRKGEELEGSRRDCGEWSRPHNGEDLQGVYWGETLALPISLLQEMGGEAPALAVGSRFPGNFFKLCEDQAFAHKGCFFSADFSKTPFGRENMGELEVVSY